MAIIMNQEAANVNGNSPSVAKLLPASAPGYGSRTHPQWAFIDTAIDPSSFFGKIRALYASNVLKAQLDQIKRSGCYDMFSGKWMPCYDVRQTKGGKDIANGCPPSLFWESDIGKWIEAVSYFLANPASTPSPHREEFVQAIDKLIGEMEAFQSPDGYLNVYFTLVDTEGKFKNLRDLHEMYNAGHLLEGAMAHYHWSGSRRFLDIMLKNVECLMREFGPGPGQRPGYDGHPEIELALVRLHAITKDPRHLAFAKHLLSARGTKPASLGNEPYFIWEAKQRDDRVTGFWQKGLQDLAYNQSHKPLHEQETVVGHAVRAMYLITGCADFGGEFLEDAKRLWSDAMERKRYVTGGLGADPLPEAFSNLPYWLPSSTLEGGCYAETCASIAGMMVSERLLSHELDGKYRDALETCLYNGALGGGSLDGTGFSYANKLATCGDETSIRPEWYEVCCCPPNLSRTLGILPGYIWSAEAQRDQVVVNVYLYVTAERSIPLPDGGSVKISMRSGVPWTGTVSIDVEMNQFVKVLVRLPVTEWMAEPKFSVPTEPCAPGYVQVALEATAPSVTLTFDLETRLIYPDPRTHQDTLSVQRGPIVFVAEDIDNKALEDQNPHFEGVGLSENAQFSATSDTIEGVPILTLSTRDAYILKTHQHQQQNGSTQQQKQALYSAVRPGVPVRSWTRVPEPLVFIPWFARANRGGKGHVRVPFVRVGADAVHEKS